MTDPETTLMPKAELYRAALVAARVFVRHEWNCAAILYATDKPKPCSCGLAKLTPIFDQAEQDKAEITPGRETEEYPLSRGDA